MSGAGSQMVFADLFQGGQSIRIPLIQRDYAQGRSDSIDVRNDFLVALNKAFQLPEDAPQLPLNLDFIYGTLNEAGQFQPLDGQQRLTTLFLLHWYIALRDGQLELFRALFCDDQASRFTYSVRPSSTEFFDALSQFKPDHAITAEASIAGLICDQPWYFRHWRLDPTIQSALTMVQAIHELFFETRTATLARLVDRERPVISFQKLDLRDFGLADDLYIKMNARGMPLTPFETFKARYEQVLEKQFEGETRNMGGVQTSVAKFFAWRLDTQWADFFWNICNQDNRDSSPTAMHLFDDAVMNMLRLIAIATRDCSQTRYNDEFVKLRAADQRNTYQTYEENGWLDRAFSETVLMLFEGWSAGQTGFALKLPDDRVFDEKAFFKTAIAEPLSISYPQIVEFVAYIEFLRAHGDSQPQAFQEWMRVVVNLTVNTTYVRPEDVRRSINGLRELIPHAVQILEYIASTPGPVTGFNGAQVSEEVQKAKLILAEPNWRALIEQAESHLYFRGQIDFLLERSEALRLFDDSEDAQSVDHASAQLAFQRSFDMAKKTFTPRGLASFKDFLWERALLTLGDYFLRNGSNWSFLVNGATEQGSWKRLLGGARDARNILFKLWDQLDAEQPLEPQLQRIITSAHPEALWQKLLIETPEAFNYCSRRQMRFVNDDVQDIYLLARERMSGAHAELNTYALHARLQREGGAALQPLSLPYYESVSGEAQEPYLYFHHEHAGREIHLYVSYKKGQFQLQIENSELQGREALQAQLCQAIGFQPGPEYLTAECPLGEIDEALLKVAALLKAN